MMPRGASDWPAFHVSPLGRATQTALTAHLRARWGEPRGLSILGVGRAGPYLVDLRSARRCLNVTIRPGGDASAERGGVRAAAGALPFADAAFDRVLMIHALEESEDPAAAVREAARVLASSGRLAIAAVARDGLWAHFGTTPLRQGRGWTARGLARLLTAAGLEVTAHARRLRTPPFASLARYAEVIERTGAALWPTFGGLVVVEAQRRDFVRPNLRLAPVRQAMGASLRPVPAASPRMRQPS